MSVVSQLRIPIFLCLFLTCHIAASLAAASTPGGHETKNLVVFCDGTGLALGSGKCFSNVVYLFAHAKLNDTSEQEAFYSPGIGTVSRVNSWDALQLFKQSFLGLAAGSGLLRRNVAQAYEFLMENYNEGDRIFLFGFSRGAYAMRLLAALIYTVGLLQPNQKNLVPYAIAAYSKAKLWDGPILQKRSIKKAKRCIEEAYDFGVITRSRRIPIHFLGCWDTVSSLIMPRVHWYQPFALTMMPYTDNMNMAVTHFRQACAIDERRRNFRLEYWDRVDSWAKRVSSNLPIENDTEVCKENCTFEQAWFVGYHGDVGGGWPMQTSGLAKIALKWMAQEAEAQKLELPPWFVEGIINEESVKQTSSKSSNFIVHDSMHGGWPGFELLPKLSRRRQFNQTSVFRGILTKLIVVGLMGHISACCVEQAANIVLKYTEGTHFCSVLLKVFAIALAAVGFVWTYAPEKYRSEPPFPIPHGEENLDSWMAFMYRRVPTVIHLFAWMAFMYRRVPTGIRLFAWSCFGYFLSLPPDKGIQSIYSSFTSSWRRLCRSSSLLQMSPRFSSHVWIRLVVWVVVACLYLVPRTYVPLGEPRPIPKNDTLHNSVLLRLANDPSYRPVNLIAHLHDRYAISGSDLEGITYQELKERTKNVTTGRS